MSAVLPLSALSMHCILYNDVQNAGDLLRLPRNPVTRRSCGDFRAKPHRSVLGNSTAIAMEGTMETVWNLLSPVGVHKAPAAAVRATVARNDRVIGFVSNRKPNATPLLENLMARLKDRGYDTHFSQKRNSETPAGDELVNQVVAECELVIIGSAD